jgi:hypothetical protein
MTHPLRVTRAAVGAAGVALSWALLVVARADHEPAPQEPAAQQPPAPGRGAAERPEAPREAKIVEGTDADDALTATDGPDWLFGKKGHDFLRGGAGRDTVDAGEGDDTIDGGPDDDIIDAGAGSDTVRGGDGNDTLDGGDDDDTLDGGGGNDDLDGGDGNDTLRGGPGDDLLSGGDGSDALDGGAGADRLSGNDGDDVLSGGAGNDDLSGGEGGDLLRGEAGDDVLDGGQGPDTLSGGPGNDALLGSGGDDTLDGGQGHDLIVGGEGRDVLTGASGDDLIVGSRGADQARGGDGSDVILLRAGDAGRSDTESIDGEQGADVLVLNGFGTARIPAIAPPTAPKDGAPPVAAIEYRLADPLTGGEYRFTNVERIEHTHVFPGIDSDRARPSTLTLVNPSTTGAASGRLTFFGVNAAATPAKPGAVPEPAGVPFTVPPLGSVAVAAPPGSAASPGGGSAQATSSVPLGSIVQVDLPGLGPMRVHEAALVDAAIVPVVEQRASGTSTGVVIFNSSVRSNVKLTLYAPPGRELSNLDNADGVEIDLPADGHRVLLVRDLFPRLGDFQGTLSIEGGIDRPQEGGFLAVTGILQGMVGGVPTAAAFPATPVGVDLRDPGLYFARIASGGGQADSLVLVNPGVGLAPDRARGALAFYDESGTAWPVALNGQSPSATASFDIAPYGSAVFTAASAGALRAGSVRVTVAEGVVGGLLRVGGGPVQTGPAAVYERFITPAARNRAAGTTTAISVASTGPAASLRLALRDTGGAEVPGGSADLQLPADGSAS